MFKFRFFVILVVLIQSANLFAQNDFEDALKKAAAENTLTTALRSLFAVAENYPDLKANQNFLQLQEEIADVENKLAAVRRYFNSATKEYNNAVQTFPSNIVAGMTGFQREIMFDLGKNERANLDQAPKISF